MMSERAGDRSVDGSGLRVLTLTMVAICWLIYLPLAVLAVGSAITQVADGAVVGGIATASLILPSPAIAVGVGKWMRRKSVDSVVRRLMVVAITLPLTLILLVAVMFLTLFF